MSNQVMSPLAAAPPSPLSGLRTIAEQYQLFLIDLWGVIHNGLAPYPGVPACLSALKEAGKTILLLSNAPRRSETVKRFLRETIGLPDTLYHHVLTSGDLTRAALEVDQRGFRTYLRIGPERDWGLLEGLNFTPVDQARQADFLLCTGLFDDETERPEDYVSRFEPAIRRGLIMICANPDLSVMRGPRQIYCAGSLAQLYGQMGGQVEWHGKPYPETYRACLALSGERDVKVLAIGDSLRTDIAGAHEAGLENVLIAGGIHAEEWGLGEGEVPAPERWPGLLGPYPSPTYLMGRLQW